MNTAYETRKTLDLILREIDLSGVPARRMSAFRKRIDLYFPDLFAHMMELYGTRYDAYVHMRTLMQGLARHQATPAMRRVKSTTEPWFEGREAVGMAVYVDLFAGDLKGLIDRIPYLEDLGVTYLHLMPLYLAPEANSDGGYAVSDYRTVNPALGTNKDLKALSRALHARGIRLVLDFVFNHTSDEHRWVRAALDGDPRYQQFYFLCDPDDADAYNSTVREIFPQVRRGSFTWNETLGKHVWTTFNSFQWDLNYANPDVFVSVVDEMLHLVSMGADVLRLDALAFVWKEMGTVCENLPKAHTVIQAFNLCLKLAAPEVVFKSEAIVHPDEVNRYIRRDECELSYNPLMMALMWESLATRRTELLNASMERSFAIPEGTAWVNYIRCHDDIGWMWDDAISARLGIDGYGHRQFLNRFYTGRFEGSFASGVPFQENPTNGDCRVCGTLASLAGVEQAQQTGNALAMEHALRRIDLLNAVVFATPGIPLLYQGDEIGVLNDDAYLTDPSKREDSRWVHRKALTDADLTTAQAPGTPQAHIHSEIRRMIAIRKANAVFGSSSFDLIRLASPHTFAFLRETDAARLLVVANFSEHTLSLEESVADLLGSAKVMDLLAPETAIGTGPLRLDAYGVHWFHTIRG